jgi:S1-C subfamily serine protease
MRVLEKRVRAAAVKVTKPYLGGHGSGSYIIYKDLHLIITAQHVADGPLGTNYLVSHGAEGRIATLIYSDKTDDVAVLYISYKFMKTEPMKYAPLKKTAELGMEIYYSGFPSTHKLMSFNGRVAGYEASGRIGDNHIILQTYGWFGCSGSVIYNSQGHQVGVLYGVDIEYSPSMQIQENMIWVVPMHQLDMVEALRPICNGYKTKKPRACK